jgi:hypothetical protein
VERFLLSVFIGLPWAGQFWHFYHFELFGHKCTAVAHSKHGILDLACVFGCWLAGRYFVVLVQGWSLRVMEIFSIFVFWVGQKLGYLLICVFVVVGYGVLDLGSYFSKHVR